MALVVGHSQVKYLSEYLCKGSYSVFAYPGAKTLEFLEKDDVFEVLPFFTTVVLVIGANDVCSKSPCELAGELELLCEQVYQATPSSTVIISEILPRGQNFFSASRLSISYLERWNREANEVNDRLRKLALRHHWLRVMDHPQFHNSLGLYL